MFHKALGAIIVLVIIWASFLMIRRGQWILGTVFLALGVARGAMMLRARKTKPDADPSVRLNLDDEM